MSASKADSTEHGTKAGFLAQAKSCTADRDDLACTEFGVLIIHFPEAVSGYRNKIGEQRSDLAATAIVSVVASDGERWSVNTLVRITPDRYALIITPRETQTYSHVNSLTFKVDFADHAAFDMRGQALPAMRILTTHDCCGDDAKVNLNFGSISMQGVINALMVGRTLINVEHASDGITRLEDLAPSNLPLGFRLLGRVEKEELVTVALETIQTSLTLDWYFEAIDERFVRRVVQHAVRAAKHPNDVMTALTDLSNNERYDRLSHAARGEAASALFDLRGAEFSRSLARAVAFSGTNEVIRAGGRSEQVLIQIRGELTDKAIDQRYFDAIALAITQHGDAPDGSYSRISRFDSELMRETRGRQIHCKPGDTYYLNGRCRIDGP